MLDNYINAEAKARAMKRYVRWTKRHPFKTDKSGHQIGIKRRKHAYDEKPPSHIASKGQLK